MEYLYYLIVFSLIVFGVTKLLDVSNYVKEREKIIEELELILNSVNLKRQDELERITMESFFKTDLRYKKCILFLQEKEPELLIERKYPIDIWLYIQKKINEFNKMNESKLTLLKGIDYLNKHKIPLIVKNTFYSMNSYISVDLWEQIEESFKDYMVIYLETHGDSLSPSKTIEEVWKIYEMNSVLYERFCNNVFGKYVPVQKRSTERETNIHKVSKTFNVIKKSNFLHHSYKMFKIDELTNIQGKLNYSHFLEML